MARVCEILIAFNLCSAVKLNILNGSSFKVWMLHDFDFLKEAEGEA
jgi:hypothetical protein